MKNYVQPGNTITLTAPYAVASGDGLLVGSIFVIAAGAAALGEPVETALVGVFDITKVGSQAWTVGAKVYWDDTNKRCTTVATDNTSVGVAVEAVLREQLVELVLGALLDGLAEQLGLAGEAAVDGAGGEPGPTGDLLHAGAVVAPLGEHGGGGLHQALPGGIDALLEGGHLE